MVWQDIVISIGTLIFTIALIPQLIKGFKEKKGGIVYSTSIPTFVCLYVISFTMFTLNLYYSSAMNFLSGTIWLLLFIQRAIYK